ncbi:prosaposin [Papilio machaon]|uniref:prosaposin n=1 Tax=Papilio machaon TaxID=76193 RepID=UPI001E663AAD|nr:prosaposin [Papilio machaon]
MTNILGVCLFSLLCFSYASITSARQLPKECSKGPSYWCQNLKVASDCGAVGHCIGTVWEKQEIDVRQNEVSEKIIRLFRQLKDVKDLINMEYLAARMNSACRDVPDQTITKYCREHTAHLEEYLLALLTSQTSPETMCSVVAMCNSEKLDNVLSMIKKKTTTPKTPTDKYGGKLLGASKCTWGPSYWCSNFSTGRECKATHHCVSRVWPRAEYPQDSDSICKICTDMVKQARDQLQSNETQEELKEVFEGSCQLIPIKLVRKECIVLADDFVPELVETLASEMNPQTVCSVAGLCNSARIDLMLEDYNKKLELRKDCNNCRTTVGVLRKRFDDTSYEDFLVGLLKMCGQMGSFSDSCSMLVFKYYEHILAGVKKDLTPTGICHLSGQCAVRYHSHDQYDFPDVKIDQLKATDDVPCEFCEQVVKHLRDVLVANTTESEFHRVLVGLCKQTGSFKEECLSLVEEYYPMIYNFLVSELKADAVCAMMGICHNNSDVPVAVLLPKELAVKVTQSPLLIGNDEANSYTTPKLARVSLKKETNVRIMVGEQSAQDAQLPIERMYVAAPQNKAACSFCQYFLHYLQVELSDVNNEDTIKDAVEKACDKLPDSVNGECKQFVTEYGPAVIALLVQEIDPASVCPALGLCPQTEEVRRVAINSDKSNCPLCLFAVEQLETMLKSNRSEENIRHALDSLCNHLSAKLRTECVDFVDTYTNQLVEMLAADMNSTEICVFLKLCEDKVHDPLKITQSIDKYHEQPSARGDRNNFRGRSMLPKEMLETDGDLMTNEIPDHTVNGRPKKVQQKSVCVICEFVMKEIDDQIKDKHNDDEIKKIVHGVCKRMPKSVRGECDQFVDKYSDLVISLLAQELDPSEVCQELKLCDPTGIRAVKEAILDCAVCETVVMAVRKVLSNDKIDHDIVHVVEKSCALLPAKYHDRCHTLMEVYGDSIIHLIEDIGTKGVCEKIGLCSDRSSAYVHMQTPQTRN